MSNGTIPVYLGATEPYVGEYASTEDYELHSIACARTPGPRFPAYRARRGGRLTVG
jgi:hypothetical protein